MPACPHITASPMAPNAQIRLYARLLVVDPSRISGSSAAATQGNDFATNDPRRETATRDDGRVFAFIWLPLARAVKKVAQSLRHQADHDDHRQQQADLTEQLSIRSGENGLYGGEDGRCR